MSLEHAMRQHDEQEGDVLVEWWLDEPALPDLNWARLQINTDGTAEIFDVDGMTHFFGTIADARNWLSQEEYLPYAELLRDEVVGPEVSPPPSFLDKEALLAHMKMKVA